MSLDVRGPELDEFSEAAVDTAVEEPAITFDPEQALAAALATARPSGITVPELMQVTGMRRPWVYERLQTFVVAGKIGK